MAKNFWNSMVRAALQTPNSSCTLAMDIGRAAAMVVARDHKEKTPAVSGRYALIPEFAHDMLESAISAGLCSVGADVVTLGTVPTPAVAYLVKNSDADTLLSCSRHRTIRHEFNGIKDLRFGRL